MIRIGNLLADDYTCGDPRLEGLCDLEADRIGSRDDSSVKRVGPPASSSSRKGPEGVRDHENERLVIVSCGADNFELTCGKRNTDKFRTYTGLAKGAYLDKDKKAHVDFSDLDVRDQFMERFKSCCPDFC